VSHATQIHGTGDLKRLCEVSKHIYNYTVPRLYQAITLRVGEEWELKDFDVEPLLRTCSTANNLLRNVKHLHLAADFHQRLDFRRVHNDSRYPALEELEEELVPLFDRLFDNSLYGFR